MDYYYQNELVTIYHGDCLNILPELDKVDLVLTDPPYRDESENQPTMDMRENGGMQNFGNKFNIKQFELISEKSKGQIIWGCNNFNFLPAYKGFFVWQKHIPEKFTMSMAEIAYVSESIMTISKVFKIASNTEKRYHPTQKPIELIKWCLNFTEGSVLDLFLGSGTTVVACMQLNRHCIGIEIEEKYCEIAAKRCEEARTGLTPAEQEAGYGLLFEEESNGT